MPQEHKVCKCSKSNQSLIQLIHSC
jgi:hypothetical protein